MTPLGTKYIRDLVIHGRSKHTQEAYTRYVCDLARYYRRSPELISYEEVTAWLYHLIKERQLSASSVKHRRQRRALSLRRYTWARDARLDGIGPAHEARHPARGIVELYLNRRHTLQGIHDLKCKLPPRNGWILRSERLIASWSSASA
jgi:predicted metal-dependent phosphoesterase TrpH